MTLQYDFNKITVLLVAVLGIGGCGGGSSSGGDTPTPTPTPTPPVFSLTDVGAEASSTSVAVTEMFLQLTALANTTLRDYSSLDSGAELACEGGGLKTITFDDLDNDQLQSMGDTILVTLDSCSDEYLASQVDGSIEIVIGEIDEIGNTNLSINASNLTVDSDMSFSGLFDVKITRSSLSESLVIATSSAISVTTNANNSLSVSDVSILRTENYSNSSYVIESNGSINDDSLGGLYTFEQVSPWKGYLLELPYEGELLVKTIESDTVVLKSDLEASAENLFMTQNGETVPIILEDITLGAFWAFQNKTTKTPIPFSTENFDFIGSLSNNILRDFPVLGEFKLLFSRPIEKVELFDEKFGSLGWPQVTTSVSSEIDGNIAIVTPAVPLEPNLSYSIPLVRAFGLSGKSDIFEQERPLRTNDSIIPLIEATSFTYRFGDTPLLDASKSVLTDGSPGSYLWREISDIGIMFANAESSVTQFTVPENADQNIELEVQVSDEDGNTAQKRIVLQHVEAGESFVSFNSPLGEPLHNGTYGLATENNGDFAFEGLHKGILLSHFGDSRWFLYITFPEDIEFEVGEYNYNDFPEVPSPAGVIGFHFQALENGCITPSGEFDIKELIRDENGRVEGLAMNFTQLCLQDSQLFPNAEYKPLHGTVRINSNLGLN